MPIPLLKEPRGEVHNLQGSNILFLHFLSQICFRNFIRCDDWGSFGIFINSFRLQRSFDFNIGSVLLYTDGANDLPAVPLLECGIQEG